MRDFKDILIFFPVYFCEQFVFINFQNYSFGLSY